MILDGKDQEQLVLHHHHQQHKNEDDEASSGGGTTSTLPPSSLNRASSIGSLPAITLKSQIEKEILDAMLEKEDDRISTTNHGTLIGNGGLHHHHLLFLLASSSTTTSTGDHDVCIDNGVGLRGTTTTQSLQHHQQQQEKTFPTSICTTSSTSAIHDSASTSTMEGKKNLFLSHSPMTVMVSTNALSSHDNNQNEKEIGLLDGMMGNLERFEICKWYYTVVDYYNFDRITVTMAMSYIDRVLWRKASRLAVLEGTAVRSNTTSRTESRRNHQDNKSFLQLLAVASLYLAIKLFETHNPIRNMLVDFVLMSQGKFSADEIIGMESYILKELEWNVVHVTVPQQFLHHLLKLAYVSFPSMNKSSANKIMNHANYFIEIVAFDNSFAQESASVIASAALLISIQQIANDTYASDAIRATLEHTIMTRKPLPYSVCGGIMMSRMEIIHRMMERIDNFVTKHLHNG